MALTLTEDLIRNRVGLEHDNLEDVKSMALPGTYHEKVVSLGSSLRKFTRLKHLDLSRNNISSLQGLEHLKVLERLNLYYNSIETLEELKRLKHNPNLKELDLRLNPVTRTETDYRLYLIHMLPNLQKLDDRSVRDRERQGALIHFSSSQATEMTHHPQREEPPSRAPNPRAEHVKTLGSARVLDDDDVEILDLIARTGGDLRQSRPLTGSSNKESSAADHSLAGLKKLDPLPLDGPQIEMPLKKKPAAEIDDVMASYKKRYPNIPDVIVTEQDAQQYSKRPATDPLLEFADEADAYNKFRSQGYFTPNPGADTEDGSGSFVQTQRDSYPPPPTQVQLERSQGPDQDEELDSDMRHRRSRSVPAEDRLRYNEAADYESQKPQSFTTERIQVGQKPENPQLKLFLFKILDLVDRYWNGTKSLHKNMKFKGLAAGAIEDYLLQSQDSSHQVALHQLREELGHVRKENSRFKRQEELSRSALEDTAATEAHLKASLQKAFTDVELLKDKVQSYAQENKRLQQKLQQTDSYPSQSQLGSTSVNQSQLEEITKQNELLRREVEKQQIQVKQFRQMQELSAMLQDSHKSLVQTNEHLLKELEETRQRHQHEVEQLSWSYNQLKKTMTDTSHTFHGNHHASTIHDNHNDSTIHGNHNASAVLYDMNS